MTGADGVREQRLVFGEDPELYDRARPGYPAVAVDDVLHFVRAGVAVPDGGHGAVPPLRALEVGAGTGKATAAFAARGLSVVALEPDPRMAAVARRNCAGQPDVRVEECSFEDWPVEPGAFDLVFSAQAWHWVRPEEGYRQAERALRHGGVLAMLWNRIRWADDDPVRAALESAYARLAPELHARRPGFPGLHPRPFEGRADDHAGAHTSFTEAVIHSHPWQATFSTEGFVQLLRTQSDHRLAEPEEREPVLAAVAAVIDEGGGTIAVPYETWVVLYRASR